ncbi:MAG: DUF58 domain-containing protein [Eubacteriales bacterium]
MKLTRWLYYLFLGISFFMGMYTGLRVYYIVFFILLFTVFAALALSRWTVYSFKYMQTLSAVVCEKGDEIILHLEIINECPIPLSLIQAHINGVSLRQDINLVFSLAPYSGQTFDISLGTPYRGSYPVGMTVLKITDALGLTVLPMDMRRLPYYRMAPLIVLPRAETPGTISSDIVDTKLFGDANIKPANQGDSVSGVRLFQNGDALKRIHWKKSAQQGALYVKQYDYPEREHITILVDTSPHGLSGEKALVYADTVCECAACIALNSLSRGRAVHMKNTSASNKPMVCNTLSKYNFLRRHLAMLPFEKQVELKPVISQTLARAQQMRSLFIITRSTVPELQTSLSTKFPVTFILVGEKQPSDHPHAIFVQEGTEAAKRLSGIH